MAQLEKVTERIDENGEVQRSAEVINIRPMPPEPPFVKMYIDDIGRLSGLQSSHTSILAYVAACVDYDGIVTLNARRKGCIAATTGCSIKTIENAVTEYLKHGIVRRIGRAEYELNPALFAKGEWKNIRERRESFSMHVSYTKSGRQIVTTKTPPDVAERERLEAKGQQRLEV